MQQSIHRLYAVHQLQSEQLKHCIIVQFVLKYNYQNRRLFFFYLLNAAFPAVFSTVAI